MSKTLDHSQKNSIIIIVLFVIELICSWQNFYKKYLDGLILLPLALLTLMFAVRSSPLASQ
jgi:hypothetical protein